MSANDEVMRHLTNAVLDNTDTLRQFLEELIKNRESTHAIERTLSDHDRRRMLETDGLRRDLGELSRAMERVLSHGSEMRGDLGKVGTTVTQVSTTLAKVRDQTDPHLRIPPEEIEDIPLSRGLSWTRIVTVTTWVVPHVWRLAIPLLVAMGAGALVRDCAAQKQTATVDGGQGAPPWKP